MMYCVQMEKKIGADIMKIYSVFKMTNFNCQIVNNPCKKLDSSEANLNFKQDAAISTQQVSTSLSINF